MATFEYAPAPESRAVVDIAPSYGLFIGGQMVDPVDGVTFKSISPSTEEVLCEVSEAGPADVDRAVQAARTAYARTWSRMPGRERGKYLFRIARLVQERARELAVLETLDNGKPIRETRDVDIPLVAAHFFYHAGWADKLGWAGLGPDPRPHGVAAQVIPWNFPLLMLAWKVAPALAAGNTVVLKPAETTPLTALLFAEICRQADLPPGVVNIVTGAGQTGRNGHSTAQPAQSLLPLRPRARRTVGKGNWRLAVAFGRHHGRRWMPVSGGGGRLGFAAWSLGYTPAAENLDLALLDQLDDRLPLGRAVRDLAALGRSEVQRLAAAQLDLDRHRSFVAYRLHA